MHSLIYRFDQRISGLIAAWPESWRPAFLLLTHLGDPIVTIGIGVIVVGIGAVLHNIRLALAGSMIWLTLSVGAILKQLFGRERPMEQYGPELRVDSFSFPSGHSSGAMIAYGLVAYLLWQVLPAPWNWVAAAVCALVVIVVGISRIYLGVHFPSDVAAGWLLGGLALGMIIVFIKPLAYR